MKGKKIAFFDFDGTITSKRQFAGNCKISERQDYVLCRYVIQYALVHGASDKSHISQPVKGKNTFLFFSGTPENDFKEQCDLFAKSDLPGFIRKGAITEMDRLRKEGFEMVIVSASAENWIRGFADRQSVELIATRLEVVNGLITGKLEGKNCSGGEKVIRIKERWDLTGFEEIYVYGDTPADKPMMALATQSFYKPFRKE